MGVWFRGVVGAVLLMGVSQPVLGADKIWIANSNGQLGTVPVAPGPHVPTVIGSLATSLTDLAWDTSGNLWGVGGPGFQHLYLVNPLTGAAADLGDVGTPLNSLACAPDGTLFAA